MKVSILGLGLIGGSLGLALRAALPEVQVRGWDHAPAAGATALRRGVIQTLADDPRAAVADAELVVLATPVLAVRDLLAVIAPQLRPGAIVTDVASTKALVLEWAGAALPDSVAFVGGHPMAGSERHGVEHARADLFQGAVWCLSPLAGAPAAAVETLEAVVQRLGAQPLRIDAATHDAAVAAVSHLPFMLAAALVQLTSSDPDWPLLRRLASSGYRDMTRLASGDVTMHRDICLTNAAAMALRLRQMARLLETLAERLDDPVALETLFATAQQAREAWLRERYGA